MLHSLVHSGWAIVEGSSPLEIAHFLGRVVESRSLTAQDLEKANPGTFSATCGRGAFPWHSDCSHWESPPKFIMLQSVGMPSGATLGLSGDRLLEMLPSNARRRVGHAVWRARTNRGAFYCSLHARRGLTSVFRYDPLCMAPINQDAKIVSEAIAKVDINAAQLVHNWRDREVLVIDNWRILHARSAVSAERTMLRLYVNHKEDR